MSGLIDTLLPRWDRTVAGRSELARIERGTDVAASPERAWAALEQVTFGELPLTRLLVRLRGLGRITRALDRPLLDSLSFLIPLAESPGGARLTTETRIAATDAAARRRFARYRRVVGFGSALIRRRAERA